MPATDDIDDTNEQRRVGKMRRAAAGAQDNLFDAVQVVWGALVAALFCSPIIWPLMALFWYRLVTRASKWRRLYRQAYGAEPIRNAWVLSLTFFVFLGGLGFLVVGLLCAPLLPAVVSMILNVFGLVCLALHFPFLSVSIYILLQAIWRITGEEEFRRRLRTIERLFFAVNLLLAFFCASLLAFDFLNRFETAVFDNAETGTTIVVIFLLILPVFALLLWFKVQAYLARSRRVRPYTDEDYDRIVEGKATQALSAKTSGDAPEDF